MAINSEAKPKSYGVNESEIDLALLLLLELDALLDGCSDPTSAIEFMQDIVTRVTITPAALVVALSTLAKLKLFANDGPEVCINRNAVWQSC
jgi:hypothetical protein